LKPELNVHRYTESKQQLAEVVNGLAAGLLLSPKPAGVEVKTLS